MTGSWDTSQERWEILQQGRETLKDFTTGGGETHLRDIEKFYDREVKHILGTLRDFLTRRWETSQGHWEILRQRVETHLRNVERIYDREVRHITATLRVEKILKNVDVFDCRAGDIGYVGIWEGGGDTLHLQCCENNVLKSWREQCYYAKLSIVGTHDADILNCVLFVYPDCGVRPQLSPDRRSAGASWETLPSLLPKVSSSSPANDTSRATIHSCKATSLYLPV